MAKVKTQLTPADYAICGLLHLQPMHGYDIARRFASDLPLVLPLDPSSIYSLLKDLKAEGLITGERETVGLRPTRTVFHLTTDAETQFFGWLTAPVERLRQVRSDLLVKLYFCRALGSAYTIQLLDAQIAASRTYRDRLEQQIAALAPGSYERLVCDSKLGPAETTLAWLEGVRAGVGL